MVRPLVTFDLDGTLVDSAPDLIDTLEVVLADRGIGAVDRDEARAMIGGGARLLIRRALAAAAITVPESEIEALNARFLEHYAAHIADRTRPFPGMTEALDALDARGIAVAVCTNKLEYLARLLLDRLDLTRRFVAITGADTYGVAKPDARPLLATIAAAGSTVGASLMVGDSRTDILTARAAAVPVIAVSFGYTEIAPAELGADVLIDHYDALGGAVEALLARAAA